MSSAATFSALTACDLTEIERQESQLMWLGQSGEVDPQTALALAGEANGQTVRGPDGRILACYGIHETFPGHQGVAWALLAEDLGPHYTAIARAMRRMIAQSGLARIELFARSHDVPQDFMAIEPFDTSMSVALVMVKPTPECRLAQLVGCEPVHVLRRFGGGDETYMLCEWIAAA